MPESYRKFLYWAPRIMGVIFTLFLALFSLDVFEMQLGFWGTLLALFMHNIPSFILLLILIISWKRELVGAVAFTLLGFAYIVMVALGAGDWRLAVSWSFIVAGPAIATGLLFFFGWQRKDIINQSNRSKE